MAAHGLGRVLGRGDAVHQHHLKGVLKDVGHVVPVKSLLPTGAVCLFQVVEHALVPADVDLEAALHPQDGFHQAVDIVVVRLLHLRRAVDEGAAGGHLAVRPLHGDAHGLLGVRQEGLVKAQQGDKVRVQGRDMLELYRDTVSVHIVLLQTRQFEPAVLCRRGRFSLAGSHIFHPAASYFTIICSTCHPKIKIFFD